MPSAGRATGPSGSGIWPGRQVGLLSGHTGLVKSAVFSPAGDRILTASEDGTARLWTLDGSEIERYAGHDMGVAMASFSPRGDRVATASWDSGVRLFDIDGELLQVLEGHSHGVPVVRYSSDGTRLLTAAFDGTARLWDPSGRVLAELRGHAEPIRAADFCETGSRLYTYSGDGAVNVWDDAGSLLGTFDADAVALSPGGERLALVRGSTVDVVDERGRVLTALRGHDVRVTTLEFSRDGDRLATGSDDFSARVWSDDGSVISEFRGHTDEINTAAFSPDGAMVITASGRSDGTSLGRPRQRGPGSFGIPPSCGAAPSPRTDGRWSRRWRTGQRPCGRRTDRESSSSWGTGAP